MHGLRRKPDVSPNRDVGGHDLLDRTQPGARTLDLQAGRVAGVVTEAGRVRCAQVVLAGGTWSNGFAANAGTDLPQLMVRSTVARTEIAPDTYSSNISQPGLSLRRRADGGYTLATGDVAEHYLSPNSFRYAPSS